METRKYLHQRKYVEVLSSSDLSSTSTSIEYLTTKRIHALLATNEMVRMRGKFGPRAAEDIYASVEAMPCIVSSEDGRSTGDTVDVERFLALLCAEMLRMQEYADILLKEFLGVEAILHAKGLLTSVPEADETQLMDTWTSKLSLALSDVENLLLLCMASDDMRSGEMEYSNFCDTLMQIFHGSTDSTSDQFSFSIEFIASSFLDGDTKLVCYLDFISVLVAHVVQTDSIQHLSLAVIIDALSTIRRGLDDAHAQKLVTYIGYAQSIQSAGKFWPFVSPPTISDKAASSLTLTGEGLQNSQLLYGTEGEWYTSVNASSDGPGNLKVDAALLSKKNADLGLLSHVPLIESPVVPIALQTCREIANVFGEIARVGGKDRELLPTLRAFELTDFVSIDSSPAASLSVNLKILPSIIAVKNSSPITDDADSDTVPSQNKELDADSLRHSLIISKRKAEASFERKRIATDESDLTEVGKRLQTLSEFEREAADRFQRERERFEALRRTKLRIEAERIRASRARERVESRRIREREQKRQLRIQEAASRSAALEEMERRRAALMDEERSAKIQREKEQRELLKRQEEEMQLQLERLRLQQEEEEERKR